MVTDEEDTDLREEIINILTNNKLSDINVRDDIAEGFADDIINTFKKRIDKEEQQEIQRLKHKINELIADNLELSSRLEFDYNPEKKIRKLTLQEKLELNMGNTLKKFRISNKDLKNIYFGIMTSDPEPQFVDMVFDNDRMFQASYKVDLEQEKQDIIKGEEIELDITMIPDDFLELQNKYDIENVLNTITKDIKDIPLKNDSE